MSDNRFLSVWQKFMTALGSDPKVLADLARRHAEHQARFLTELANGKDKAEGKEERKSHDRRFEHPAWEDSPFYRLLKESYTINSEALQEAAEKVGFEGEDKRALDFIVKQLVSAASPTNFAITNPEVATATMESKGENLRKGMENYLEDLKRGKMTLADPDAFRIGENIAATKGKVIAENRLMQLIEYTPTTEKVYAKPILIVPPCINKYYILDLTEKNSFIRHMLDQGFRVFLISWVNAGEQHAQLSWDDYVSSGVIEAVDIACEVTEQETINTIGYCIGGTLLASAVAILHAKGVKKIATQSMFTSFVDYCNTGDIGLFVNEKGVKEIEERYADGGIFPGARLHQTFSYLRPDDLVWPYVVRNYLLGETPPAFDILHWNSDSTNLPGKMYAWFLRHTYYQNDFKDGKAEICGTKVDPTAPNLPGVYVATERDHIVPWDAAYASARIMGNKATFILASSGHVAGIINPPSSQKGRYRVAGKQGKLPAKHETWLSGSKEKKGSWWPELYSWLATRSGKKVAAPRKAGDYRHLPIENAPGSYVSAPLPLA